MLPTYSPMNGQLRWLLKQVERTDRIHRVVIWLANAGIFAFSGVAAFLLRFDLIRLPSDQIEHLVYGVSIWVVVKTVVFRLCCLDRGWWRFVSIRDLFCIAAGNALASAGSTVVILLVAPKGFPRSGGRANTRDANRLRSVLERYWDCRPGARSESPERVF